MTIVEDWYRHGSGDVPDIILRVAEEVRKCLSNQKIIEVVVPLTEDGWKRLGDESLNNLIIGPPIDKTSLETEYINEIKTWGNDNFNINRNVWRFVSQVILKKKICS